MAVVLHILYLRRRDKVWLRFDFEHFLNRTKNATKKNPAKEVVSQVDEADP